MLSHFRTVAAVLAFMLLTSVYVGTGCAPKTPIRRTALIPNAFVPSRTGRPLETGELRASFEINTVRLNGPTLRPGGTQLVANVGDPGVLIPRLNLGGSLYMNLFAGLEIGGHFRFAHYDWAKANTVGVLPFPDFAKRNLFFGGIGLRYNFHFPYGMSLSLLTEVNFGRIPQSTFVCKSSQACNSGYFIPTGNNGTGPEGAYVFEKMESEMFVLPAFFVQFTWAAWRDHVHVYMLLGAERNVKNIGFDPDVSNKDNSTLSGFWLGVIGVGVELKYRWVFANVTFTFPLESERAIDFGIGMHLNVGATFDLY